MPVLHRFLTSIREPRLALAVDSSVKPFNIGDTSDRLSHQIFEIALEGTMLRGQILHIWFHADAAYGEKVAGCPFAGTAPLFYYNAYLEDQFAWLKQPFFNYSVVPCLFLNVLMLFPERLTAFQPEKIFGRSHLINHAARKSPNGQVYRDERWFTICHAHNGNVSEHFVTSWELPKAQTFDSSDVNGAAALQPLGTNGKGCIQNGHQETEMLLAMTASKEFPLLSKRLREISLLLSQGYSASAIAGMLGVQPQTVHNYIHRIYDALGLNGDRLPKSMRGARRKILAEVVAIRSREKPTHTHANGNPAWPHRT